MRAGVNRVCITIQDGALTFVDDAPLASLNSLGVCSRRRVSRIEPNHSVLRLLFYACRAFGLAEWTRWWTCWWRVNMSPVDGPIIPMSRLSSRADALAVEREWLWTYRSM